MLGMTGSVLDRSDRRMGEMLGWEPESGSEKEPCRGGGGEADLSPGRESSNGRNVGVNTPANPSRASSGGVSGEGCGLLFDVED